MLPLHLFMVFLLSSLGLHLLHLNGVRLSPPHVQLMIAHAQSQYALVDTQTWGIKHKILQRADAFNSNRKSIFVVVDLLVILQYTTELTGAFLSIGFMTNFLSLKEMFRISLQGKPIFGVNLKKKNCRKHEFTL